MEDLSVDTNNEDKTLSSLDELDKRPSYLSFQTDKDRELQNSKLKFISDKNDRSNIMANKKITNNSKIKLWTSLILIILSLIFIPFYSLANTYLIILEKNTIIDSLNEFVSYETLNSSSLKNLFIFFNLFLNKDFMAGYLCLLYIVLHPFVAMKITYGINFSYCVLVLMQILYQSRRPSWDSNSEIKDSLNDTQIIICEASFSNPSSPLYTFIFCTIYSLYSYRQFYSPPRSQMNIILKIILFIVFISFLITEMVLLIIYRLHYLHELLFTICLAFIMISLLIGFENKLQNIIFNATKNFFKIRKNKIKIFLYIIFELLCGILLFNLIGNKFSTYQIEANIMRSDSCSKQQKEELSLSNSFMDLSYIFCLLGEFWGASLTLENKVDEWWYQTKKYFNSRNTNREINERSTCLIFTILLKGFITIVIYVGIWFLFNYIPYINFLFNFVINCAKYFLLFFICTGVLPIVYGLIGLNKKFNISSKRLDEILEDSNSNNLFKSSLFVKCFDKSRIPMFTGDNKIKYVQLLSEDLYEEEEEQ